MAAIDRLIDYVNRLVRRARSEGWDYFFLPIYYAAKEIGVTPSMVCRLRKQLEKNGSLVIENARHRKGQARRYVPLIIPKRKPSRRHKVFTISE